VDDGLWVAFRGRGKAEALAVLEAGGGGPGL